MATPDELYARWQLLSAAADKISQKVEALYDAADQLRTMIFENPQLPKRVKKQLAYGIDTTEDKARKLDHTKGLKARQAADQAWYAWKDAEAAAKKIDEVDAIDESGFAASDPNHPTNLQGEEKVDEVEDRLQCSVAVRLMVNGRPYYMEKRFRPEGVEDDSLDTEVLLVPEAELEVYVRRQLDAYRSLAGRWIGHMRPYLHDEERGDIVITETLPPREQQ